MPASVPPSFYIDLEQRWAMYSPGEEVRGVVHLHLYSPLPCHQIDIAFTGKAKVFWQQRELVKRRMPNEDEALTPGRFYPEAVSDDKQRKQLAKEQKAERRRPLDWTVVSYSNDKVYVNESTPLWRGGAEGGQAIVESLDELVRRVGTYRLVNQASSLVNVSPLPVGKHEFPFTFTLPVDCPSSFEHAEHLCHIRYGLKAGLHTRAGVVSKYSCSREIGVVRPLDLNRLPVAARAVHLKEEGNDVWAVLEVAKCGFTAAEKIDALVKVTNQSHRSLKHISLELVQHVECHGWSDGCGVTDKNTSHVLLSTSYTQKVPKEGGNCEWRPSLLLPAVTPTLVGCPDLIHMTYTLRLTVCASNPAIPLLRLSTPIVVGTVAIDGQGAPPTYDTAIVQQGAPPAYALVDNVPSPLLVDV